MRPILIIEDEPKIVAFISRALNAHGFSVESAHTGTEGLALARTGRYELVLLDLRLPELDGISILRELLRERPEQRVLVLSALTDVESRVRCLELGASDFLAKPFALAELLARLRARLKQPVYEPRLERFLTAGSLRLELLRRIAAGPRGAVTLSEREFLLLRHLMEKQGEVCTREELLGEVWGYNFDPGTNVVDVYIRRLRAKLGPDAIETVRNVGYYLPAAA